MGEGAGLADECGIGDEVGEAEVCEAGLGGAEHIAGATQAEVCLGDLEAIGSLLQYGELLDGLGELRVGEEDAVGFFLAPADAAAELVELGEAEALGVVEDHEIRIRDIDADLDDGGGDEGLERAVAEGFHDGVFFLRAELAVDEADVFWAEAFLPFGEGLGDGLGFYAAAFLDEGVDEVGLAAFCELGFHEVCDVFLLRLRAEGGDDFAAAGGFFIEDGDIEVSVDGHGEGARDGGGGHDEDVWEGAVGDECGALDDAEFMLLVDDDEAEVSEEF